MAITGAQIRTVLTSQGAGDGLVAGYDQLASGADAAMRMAGIKTLNAAAAFMATMCQESNYFRTTTEGGSGQAYAPYIGRTFQQITGNDSIRGYNYAAFGTFAKSKGMTTDAGVFVKNPALLAGMTYAWLGGVWYWTTPRSWSGYSNLVKVADTGSILMVSRAVNAGNPYWTGTPNGMATRTALYNAFRALGSSIIPGTSTPVVTSAPPGYINGTAAQVVNAAIAGWNKYKNRYYGNAWPGLRDLRDIGARNEAWCGHAVRWMIRKGTGYDIKNWCPTYAWTPDFAKKANRDPLWQEVTYGNARGGDVVFYFKTAANARALYCYHVGLVEAGPTAAGHDMRTIEGNTSTPGISNSMSSGGTYARKTRSDLETAYYRMRIFRPPYWSAPVIPTVPTDPPVPPPTEPTDPPVEVKPERPAVTTIDAIGDDIVVTNPINELNPSPSFLASITASSAVRSKVTAWYDGRQTGPIELPLVQDESTVKVSSDSTVRRTASLEFQEDSSDAELRDLYELLRTPGIQLRVETGYSYGGGAVETVPVHTGLCDTPKRDWPTRRITVDSPDLMALVAMRGFGGPVVTSSDYTFAETVAFFACESVPRSRLVDLTGNRDYMLSVIFDGTPTSRVDAVMECAQAIGAELFASPVPERFVLRPIASLLEPSRWTVQAGVDLISLSETTDWSKVRNLWEVISERADSETVRGSYRQWDGPLRWDGPFGGRVGYFHTSLLADREQCETAAKGLFDRYVGARVSIDWQMLRNPLLEAGDRVTVMTERDAYEVVVDSFEVPLGGQHVTSASARTMTTEGIN